MRSQLPNHIHSSLVSVSLLCLVSVLLSHDCSDADELKDPLSGNLDRIQIIKGWLDKKGKTHEKVYDVAWSGDRSPGADGKLPPVGNTVDIEAANWTNTIGASELATVWTDPDFDSGQRAFYYARVLEIPTPRWVLYDKVRLGAEIPPEATLTGQERAYTSPIWYTP